jgi:hypothetical protein
MLMLFAVHHRGLVDMKQPAGQAELSHDIFHQLRTINAMVMPTQLHGRIRHMRIFCATPPWTRNTKLNGTIGRFSHLTDR